MSEPSIPPHNGEHKPFTIFGLIRLDERTNKIVERVNDKLGADSPMRFELVRIPVPGAPPAPAKPKRRRREERKSGLWLVLQSAQEHGITHPTMGGFLQLPREFDAILALEQKATAQVVLEVLRQTIGTPEYDQHGNARRREWATISQEHFARAGLMTNKAAWRGIKEALKKGYIVRREVGAQRYEYAIRWRGTN
jgi:hypothetical protein